LTRVLSAGVIASLAFAGCGGSSDKSSTAATSTSATTSTATTASAPTSGIASRLLTGNELPPGFTGSQPSVVNSISGWISDSQTPTQDVASETKRLTRLGFVAGAREDLTGRSGVGTSVAEQFKTAAGARSELARGLKLFKASTANFYKPFRVAGIPGALGFAETGQPNGVNVAFASGGYYYLVGAQVPATASSEATLIAAAKRLYQRVHG
jgi:hypothetical protein